MIRYICVNSVRHILHSFAQLNAVVEEIETGHIRVVPVDQCRMDPPTQKLVDAQEEQAKRQRAANNSRGPLLG